MKKTMLEKAINGREVIAYVNGLFTPYNKNSNLYKAIVRAGYTPYDIGKSIEIAVGAHRQRGTEGWKMAIVKSEAGKNLPGADSTTPTRWEF